MASKNSQIMLHVIYFILIFSSQCFNVYSNWIKALIAAANNANDSPSQDAEATTSTTDENGFEIIGLALVCCSVSFYSISLIFYTRILIE